MKINAQEILLINKNMKFGENPTAPISNEEKVTEPPVSNPESTLSALDLQGKNNIAFQGVNQSLLQKMKNLPKAATLAIGLMVAASGTLTSCMKQEQYMNQDYDALIEALRKEITDPITKEQQKTNELLYKLLSLTEKDYYVSQENHKLLLQILAALGNIEQNDAEVRALLNAILEKIEYSIEHNKQTDEETIKLLETIIANQNKFGEENKELLVTLINKVDKLDATVKQALSTVVERIDTLGEEQNKLLTKILNAINLNNNISAANNKMLAVALKQLAQLDNNDKASMAILNRIWVAIEKSIKEEKEMDRKEMALLQSILENIQNFNADTKENLLLLIESVKNLDSSVANSFAKLFDKLDNIGNDGQKLLNEILNQVINGNNMNAKQTELLASILDAMSNIDIDNNPEIVDLLNKIWDAIQADIKQDHAMNEKTHYLLHDILDSIKNFNAETTTLLKEILAKSDKLGEEQIRLLNVIIKNQEKLSAQGKESTNKILEAINNNTNVAKGTHVLVAEILGKMDKLGDKADKIIDAIANISTGGNVDLSTIEKMLADILAQEKANGEILSSADAKASLVLITLEGLKKAIQDGDQAILDKIQEVIDNMPESCKCDAKLDEVIKFLQKIIDNAKNDESIKGDLGDLEDMFQ